MNTKRQYNPRHFAQRDGVTLLFVLSMVVLFLLMGTTFMVVSNDFYRAAIRRSTVLTNVVEPEKLLDRCFYDLLRGPSLNDSASPLRGHSILADQYGYGFKCAVFNDGAGGPDFADGGSGVPVIESGPFARFYVNASPTLPAPVLGITRVLQPEPTAAYIDLEDPAAQYVDGIYGGRVLTVLSGALKGHSSRIIYNEFIANTAGSQDDNRLAFTLPDDGLDWTLLQNGDLILVNGRDFSGLGCGETTALLASTVNPDAESDLGAKATRPNRVGDLFDPAVLAASTTPGLVKLNATTTGYLASDGGPNEPWDAPDYQNMFLSGPVGAGGFIPSFHRDTLYANQVTPLAATQLEQIRQFSFRPFHITTPGGAADYSTASAGSPFDGSWYDRTTGLITAGSGNMTTQLDVDSDNDGVLDAVWIDIGLPDQIDSDGNTFRPLVAYRVTDLDGRLNVNAHGSYADEEIQDAIRNRTKPVTSRGAGYGVSEVTLEGLFPVAAVGSFANYRTLLNSRYTDPRGGNSTPDALPGSEVPSTSFSTLDSNQKQFGYPIGANSAVTGDLFRTPGDLFAQFEIETGGTFASTNMTLPELPTPVAPTTPAAAVEFFTAPADIFSPYSTNFSFSGSTGDDLFAANELEVVLRPFDVDSVDLPTRLSGLLQPLEQNATTHSFEVSVPAIPFSLADQLSAILSGMPLAAKNTIAAGVLPRDAILGKKLDINRPLGNGTDDDGDGVVDNNPAAPGGQTSLQEGAPILDLDNDDPFATVAQTTPEGNDTNAKQLLAKDLYITAMLSCSNLTGGGTALEPATLLVSNGTPAAAYAQMIAQWAVNIVDFRDPDSIMTRFNYDPTPFDTGGWTPPPASFVFGAERPELLINETFAYHDRATEDRSSDSSGPDPHEVSDGDRHWDSAQVPRSGAFFELYHPWVQDSSAGGTITHELVPQDFGTTGVNLGQATALGDPVWRMAFRRDKTDAAFNRAVYFTNASAVRPLINADVTGNYFFTSLGSKVVAPGEYAVIGSSGNAGVVGGNYRTTFGRLQGPPLPTVTEADINATRGIRLNPTTDVVTRIDGAGNATTTSAKVIVIDQANIGPRSLSISDPNGGYVPLAPLSALDGVYEINARDLPYDDGSPDAYRDTDDGAAILTNGTADNFRFAYLQRLANPLINFNPVTNPYITIDVAGVDLLSFNGMTFNQNNGMSAEPGSTDGETEFRSAERGESFGSGMLARQNFFTSDDGVVIAEDPAASPVAPADMHNFSYVFQETLGAQNVSHIDATFTPISWLTWNDRPFANAAELANVPFLSAEGLTYNFNMGSRSVTPQSIAMVTELETMAYFGRADDNFRHLMRLGQDNGISAGTAGGPIPSNAALTAATALTNRMINFLEHVEVPNRFLGSETFLSVDGTGTVVDGNEAGLLGATPRFQPPFHSIPNFRTPGKVNLNTVPSTIVWDSLFSGTTAPAFATFLANRNMASGPTDFAGFYSSPMAGEFVVPGQALPTTGKGADKTIFRNTTPAVSGGVYDVTTPFVPATSTSARDPVGSAYFRNELQQKLGNVATTRSSVFAIWITVGYFNVDEFGRLGTEVGSAAGEVNRNRAFYMIDRSIPVAFEPGNDHNVDDVVLVRTIID